MEHHQICKLRFSYRIATFVVCFFNLITALFLLHSFLSSTTTKRARTERLDHPVTFRYSRESEEIRRAMEPLALIKRVREIEQEAYMEQDTSVDIPKQTAAAEVSKRLMDSRVTNDEKSRKALEEWLRRKMERAKHQENEKNGTITS